jgi:hypothetical protein
MDWTLAEKFIYGFSVVAVILLIAGLFLLVTYEKSSTGYTKGFSLFTAGYFGCCIGIGLFYLSRYSSRSDINP